MPTVPQASVELASPLLPGISIGKQARLEAIVASACPPQGNGHDPEDPWFSFLLHKRQEAGRAVGAARLKLQQHPAVFMTAHWAPRQVQLSAADWSVFVDGVYAAYVVSNATNNTDDGVVRRATIVFNGSCHWITDVLMTDKAEGLTQGQLRLRIKNEMLAAASKFHESLA